MQSEELQTQSEELQAAYETLRDSEEWHRAFFNTTAVDTLEVDL
jgi:hypothetical protein